MVKKVNFDCDVVLISVGRKPNTNNLNLDTVLVLNWMKRKELKQIKVFKRAYSQCLCNW